MRLRRLGLVCGLIAGLATLAGGVATRAGAELPGVHDLKRGSTRGDAYATTVDYVVRFYPLWFSYYQSRFASVNRLVGPDRVTPLYQIVVAINVDTLYASTFLDLTAEPVILKIPATGVTYSILTLDPYGDVFATGLVPTASGGTYALYGPGFAGTLPPGVTPVAFPLDHMILIFRADKFSSAGVDQMADAERFRRGIFTQPLCAYLQLLCPSGIPSGGTALILPEIAFSLPFKTVADALIATDPIAFLQQLQVAVAAPNTPPLSPRERALSDRFDRLFGDGSRRRSAFSAGARDAHAAILERYLTNRGPTGWIHFTNIGAWGDNVIERSAITEFIQYGNNIGTAAYFHAFRDGQGAALDGDDPRGYVLTFSRDQLPEAKRFWSVTAYTPESIELIANPAGKYGVASYTPGLTYGVDGSLTIHIARELPAGVPAVNWLPVSSRPFNIMLRVYGTTDSIGSYVPPAIEKSR